ncbi:tyrosine-type recombinase/integrase [Thermaerobacter litoralis]
MIVPAPRPRDAALVRLLYGAGLRVSGVCRRGWRDLTPAEGDGGFVHVVGKGGVERTVRVSAPTWQAMTRLRRPGDGPADPMFRSRRSPVGRSGLADRAPGGPGGRLGEPVSPHWLRHAHATHALERGAPMHLVQVTLGHRSVATMGRYLHTRPQDSSAHFLPA